MAVEEKTLRIAASQFKDAIESAHKLAVLIATVLGLITLTSDNRPLEYIFIAVACASVDWFLWQTIRHKGSAAISMTLITAAAAAWIGFNGWQDWKGILFSPAKPGEALIVVAEFNVTGRHKIYATERIIDGLRDEIARAANPNIRIERAPKIEAEDRARRVGQTHRAVSVIWGWSDDFGFRPRITVMRKMKRPIAGRQTEVATDEPGEFGIYIRRTLPAQMTYLALLTVGHLYYSDDRFDDALRVFELAANLEKDAQARLAPEDLSTLHLYRGLAYTGKGDLGRAVAALSKAIALDGKNALAYNNLGVAFRWKNELDQALAAYGRAIELDHGYADAYNGRGDAYYQKGNVEQAVGDFSKAIQFDPELGLAYYNRGVAYQAKGSLDSALADYTRAICLDPKNAFAFNNRGNTKRSKRNLDGAVADFDMAIALAPRYGPAHSNRGVAHFDGGDFERAIADYTKAIDLDPNDDFAYNNRGNANRVRGNLVAALTDLNKAIDLNPQLPDARENRGLLYRQRGWKLLAIAEFETYLRLRPDAKDRAEVEQWLLEMKVQ